MKNKKEQAYCSIQHQVSIEVWQKIRNQNQVITSNNITLRKQVKTEVWEQIWRQVGKRVWNKVIFELSPIKYSMFGDFHE